jgi:hypothetical protein
MKMEWERISEESGMGAWPAIEVSAHGPMNGDGGT